MGSIYKITNTLNGKAYIGQTIHDAEKTRIRQHFSGHGNKYIKEAIEEYGIDVFTFEILHDGIIPELLKSFEKEAIAKFNCVHPNGYNENRGGSGVCSHSEEARRKISKNNPAKRPEVRRKKSEAQKGRKKHSDQSRRKISEAKKGENNPMKRPEVRQRNAEAQKGRKHSDETKRKMSEAHHGEKNHNYGKSLSEETRRKISEANSGENHPQYGKPLSEETRRKISEAQEIPERTAARDLFFSLPPDMALAEKRRVLRQKITGVHRTTIYRWTHKWSTETLTSTDHRRRL